jgi:hypothetical protein
MKYIYIYLAVHRIRWMPFTSPTPFLFLYSRNELDRDSGDKYKFHTWSVTLLLTLRRRRRRPNPVGRVEFVLQFSVFLFLCATHCSIGREEEKKVDSNDNKRMDS